MAYQKLLASCIFLVALTRDTVGRPVHTSYDGNIVNGIIKRDPVRVVVAGKGWVSSIYIQFKYLPTKCNWFWKA